MKKKNINIRFLVKKGIRFYHYMFNIFLPTCYIIAINYPCNLIINMRGTDKSVLEPLNSEDDKKVIFTPFDKFYYELCCSKIKIEIVSDKIDRKYMNKGSILKWDRLLPSFIAEKKRTYNLDKNEIIELQKLSIAVRFLKGKALKKYKSEGRYSIFLTRKDSEELKKYYCKYRRKCGKTGETKQLTYGAERRSIPNDLYIYSKISEVIPDLKYVSTESMSLFEQIRIFSNAEIFILQHGGAMVNVLWMKNRISGVIELIKTNKVNDKILKPGHYTQGRATQFLTRYKKIYLHRLIYNGIKEITDTENMSINIIKGYLKLKRLINRRASNMIDTEENTKNVKKKKYKKKDNIEASIIKVWKGKELC